MTPQLKQLFDGLSDAVLMLSAEGKVRFANDAARSMMGAQLGQPISSAVILKEIAAAKDGYTTLPKRLELEQKVGTAAGRLHATLLSSPLGKDYVVILRDESERSRYRNTLANLCEFISGELSNPLAALDTSVKGLWKEARHAGRETPALQSALVETQKSGADLLSKLSKLSSFAELFAQAKLVTDERIDARSIVIEAWDRVKARATSKGMKCNVRGLSGELPAMYGSRRWLAAAFGELLENAVRACPAEGELDISGNVAGNFLVFSVRNRGLGPSARQLAALQEPFNALGSAEPTGRLGLGVPMASRIIAMHGGNLRIDEEDGEFTQFRLELPVGAPKSERDHLEHEQLQRYAQDLAQLMARRQQRAAPATQR